MSYPKGYDRICLTSERGMTRPVVKELKMDKYEYNVKLEQIKKLIKKKDYATAARIADTIDWYKVKNNQTIIMIADVYEASGRYDQSKENLKLAYDRSGLGRQIAYKLVKICIKCGELEEAEDFYDDFVSAAPKDISKYILQYELAKAKGDPIDKQISILEQYLEEDMDDKWAFELAKLYHKSGQRDKCIRQCDTVMLWFSDGKYVERAMDLKMIYTPLNKSQQERYEARWREKTGQTGFEAEEIRVKEVDVSNKYNTQNIQAALKESMDELYSEEKKESGKRENIFRPTMPSPEYEETHEQYEYSEEALYEEAEETAAGADDYLYRMNQNPQYDEASFDFAQESEQHIDDLGDTKVFVTTRSKKNLGDTKVFAPIRQAVPERINFEETANETENEAYILEEKTIKNTSGLFYEEESEENLKEIWGNPEGIVENSEEEFIEEEQELPEEELQEEFIEEEQEFPIEELQEEFIEEEQEFPI
ncbi:MAG: tetratricopeptide repeat protein, partial [Lachnospiraceae bacterium]|nr:tetratricopeptide repeat protein [Lachnospiraceae bacterium]